MSDALLLVGRETARSRQVLETHAGRLRERGVADAVQVAQFDQNPTRTVRDALDDVDAAETYVVPAVVDREHFPTGTLQRSTDRDVHVGEPVGHSPGVTSVVLDRARTVADVPAETSLVLVGLGRGGAAGTERALEYHADRVRASTTFDQVVTGYLAADPSVECVGYEVANDDVVVVPLFVARSQATDERIPDLLSLKERMYAYTSPLGTHEGLTSSLQAEFARQRVLRAETTESDAQSARDSLIADGNGAQPIRRDSSK